VNGLEIGGRVFFDQLPGAWSGIGVEANYTRVNSNSPDQLAFGMDGNKISNVPIVGLSKDNFNINLLYDKGPWDARLAYSWRSDYLTSTASNGTEGSYAFAGQPAQYGCAAGTICYALPLYANAFGQLDGSASYKVNDNIKVSLQLTNILGAIAKTKMEILTGVFATRSWFDVDRRAELAVHLSY
jgi:TonB-dependent receptor